MRRLEKKIGGKFNLLEPIKALGSIKGQAVKGVIMRRKRTHEELILEEIRLQNKQKEKEELRRKRFCIVAMARKRKRLTQKEVAEMLGLSYSTITRFETAKVKTINRDKDKLIKLAEILDININDLQEII